MRIVRFIGALLIVCASPAMAKDAAAWVVTQKSGDVRVIRDGVQPASVQVRSALSAGDVVATGTNGRAMLTRGDDYVVVAPGSRLLLPKEDEKGGFTRLVQQVGTMLYKVKHTGVPHFAVETPMLAAVVKGTSFTVVADDRRAVVQVTEGLVEVTSATGNSRRLVEGGMTVYVGRERPSEIVVVKPGDPVLPGSGGNESEAVKIEGSGDVPLSAVTDLTGGLVREAPAVAVAAAPTATALTATPVANTTTPATSTDVVTSVAEVVTTVTPAITDPVVAIVDTVVPAVTQPVVEVVQTTVPVVTQPVVEIVQTTVPVITQPIVEVVQTTVPVVTQPVVEIVQTTVPAVTQPVVAVVQPVVAVVQPVVPVVTQPVTGIIGGLLGP